MKSHLSLRECPCAFKGYSLSFQNMTQVLQIAYMSLGHFRCGELWPVQELPCSHSIFNILYLLIAGIFTMWVNIYLKSFGIHKLGALFL